MTFPAFPAPESGLRKEQVAERQAQGRQNTLPEKVTKSTGQILKDNICTLFNLFNALIAVALGLVGAWSNMLFILVVALNTLIGVAHELRAKRLVERLSLLSTPTAKAVRDGAVVEIPVEELVEGDVMELEAGRQVCADCVILAGQAEVDESLLTGESDALLRRVGDHLLSGSAIVSGRCRAGVEHVGLENYAARIAHDAKRLRRLHSELLASMRKVTRFTGFLIPPLGVCLFLEAFLARGEAVNQAVVGTAAALLGMLPKGLVLLISISLALGVATLSKKRVLVQELFALETLAHVDVLCLDKTGTLTQGKMRVEEVLLTDAGRRLPFAEIMGSFVRCADDNNATFQALKAHFAPSERFAPLGKIPFSSERKWSAMQFRDFTFVVGAPERLAGAEAAELLARPLREGKRVLFAGVARGPVRAGGPLPPVEGLATVILSDPLRPSAADTLAYFQRQGVTLKLISGDNPATASALAAKAGFPDAQRAIDMSGVSGASAIAAAAAKYAVFGRVSPAQKKQLLRALRKQGHTVAMIGDGVNDLPALREADCSVAVAAGSDAARQASQVVLLDSDFAALPEVLRQGRRVVNNITRVAGVFFVKTIYSVLLAAACLLLNVPFPLAPIQVTLIDLVIEGYPSFFMALEPDGRRVEGRFLPTVLRRAFPNAFSILICFFLWLAATAALAIPPVQADALFYLLVGTVGIQAVVKASLPMNRLRAFLCATTAAGFYAAVFLFHGLLGVALPMPQTLLLFAGFALASFLIERGMAAAVRRMQPPVRFDDSRSLRL